jgi:hypothetical protein
LEIELIFSAIADAMPDIAKAGDPVRLRSGWINGIKRLPVTYRPSNKHRIGSLTVAFRPKYNCCIDCLVAAFSPLKLRCLVVVWRGRPGYQDLNRR